MITRQQTKVIRDRLRMDIQEVLLLTPEQLQKEIDKIFVGPAKLTGTPDELRRMILMHRLDVVIPDSLCF